MNMNLKLILLGLVAMLVTAIVFTAIEAVLIRPAVVSNVSNPSPQTGTQKNTENSLSPSLTSVTPTRTRGETSTPILLLTLPGDPFSETPTLVTPIGMIETAVNSPSPVSSSIPGKTEAPQISPTVGGLPPTVSPTSPNIPAGTAGIQGRVLFNGSTINGTIVLKLVDQTSNEVQQISFTGGDYSLQDLQPSVKGYQVVFSLEQNPHFSQDQVTSQVVLGPLPAGDRVLVRYPDLEIALQGLEPLEPRPDAILSDNPISPERPLRFEWSIYPSLSQYRVELKASRLSQPVWVSGYVNTDSVVFDGVLASGALIEPGTYWWSVSARSANGVITVFGPTAEFTVDW